MDNLTTLTVDQGPDIVVDYRNRQAFIETFCAKTGKNVGNVSLYRAKDLVLCYIVDKRQPLGKVRQIFAVRAEVDFPAKLLQLTGNNTSVKGTLKSAGYKHPSISISIDQIEISDC